MLRKLIKFRNEYPAFDGEFKIIDSSEDEIRLSWEKADRYCILFIELKTNKSIIEYAELTNHIEYYAYEAGYKVLICNSYQDSDKERDYVEMLKRNQVDGIIIGSHTLDTSDYINGNLPIVAIDRNLSEGVPFITSDNYRGGLLATNLLIDKGCRKLAHISLAALIVSPLTTVKQPIKEMAELLMITLVSRMDNKETAIENILPVSLVERKTT
jgi:DNA-binding LacI/PurR family transcriptional regulator